MKKKYLISFYYREQGSHSRLGGYMGDRAGYGNKVFEGDLPQDDAGIMALQKELANTLGFKSLAILTISPLQ